MTKTILQLAVLVIIIATVQAFAAFSEPNQGPPPIVCPSGDPGCDPPINVSGNTQTKPGVLNVNGFQSYYDATLATVGGNVGIGTVSPGEKLHVSAGNYDNIDNRHLAGGDGGAVIESENTVLQIIGQDLSEWMSHIILSGVPASGPNKHWIMYNSGIDSSNKFKLGYKTSSVTNFNPSLLDSEVDFTITTAGNVGIGTVNPNAKLEINGGMRLNTTFSKPSCSSTARGTLWFTQGASGVKDALEVCAKDAANTYAWRVLY